LKFSEEQLLSKLRYDIDHRNWTQSKADILHRIEHILTLPPIDLSPEGINFIDRLLEPPQPAEETHYGRHKIRRPDMAKKDHIYTLLLATQSFRFRVNRDHDRDFTENGMSLVITGVGKSSTDAYGVIYHGSPIFYPRHSVRGHTDENALTSLRSSIAEISNAIAIDPEQYFSTMGKQCGMCMFLWS
jgi:hypothetical protein